jgi:formate dehydrogenase assembly factor FdhD
MTEDDITNKGVWQWISGELILLVCGFAVAWGVLTNKVDVLAAEVQATETRSEARAHIDSNHFEKLEENMMLLQQQIGLMEKTLEGTRVSQEFFKDEISAIKQTQKEIYELLRDNYR